jgi:hypothetical protein
LDGDLLTVVGVSTNSARNGIVSLSAGSLVTYTPSTGFSGTDTFTYTVSDGFNGSNTATVTVTVQPLKTGPILSIQRLVGGHRLRISGLGSDHFDLQRSATLSNWITITNLTLPVNGIWVNDYLNLPNNMGFYRTRQTP